VKPSATCVAAAENELITLTLKEAKLEDAGNYRCEAANKLGSVKTDCKLTVEGK
jgi:Immunoglobulin I-set domain